MRFKPAAIVACMLLAACDSSTLDVQVEPTQVPVAEAADPVGVQMLPVRFRVVNKDNLESFLAEMRASQGSDNAVFIAFTTQDYENLALNLADLKRYISQQKSVIVYYKNMVKPLDKP